MLHFFKELTTTPQNSTAGQAGTKDTKEKKKITRRRRPEACPAFFAGERVSGSRQHAFCSKPLHDNEGNGDEQCYQPEDSRIIERAIDREELPT